MTVVFDLDYTLLDTAAFKDAMAVALADCDIAAEDFWSFYELSSHKGGVCDYDPARHVELLGDRLTCGKDEALARLESVVSRVKDFVFPGAMGLLARLRADGDRLVLLTHGNVEWQKRKTVASGMADLFDELLFVPEEKEKAADILGKLKPPVAMVNDNGREIDGLLKLFPDFKMIAVRGPKDLPADPRVAICDDLEEVYKKLKEA